jgi:hypothetical protein
VKGGKEKLKILTSKHQEPDSKKQKRKRERHLSRY